MFTHQPAHHQQPQPRTLQAVHATQAIRELRHGIQYHRTLTWRYQDRAGVARTRTVYAERRTSSVRFLGWINREWLRRQRAASRLTARAIGSGSLRAFAGCLAPLVDREDPSWSPTKWNSQGSGAYGLPQALPGSKMKSAGADWQTNPYTQLRWMRGYVMGRYGSCAGALAHSDAYGWY